MEHHASKNSHEGTPQLCAFLTARVPRDLRTHFDPRGDDREAGILVSIAARPRRERS